MAASTDGPSRRPFNPFDSDVEDDALDPMLTHFGEEDDEDLVDFSGVLKRSKKKDKKLKGPAESVQVLDDEEGKGDAVVIGQMWESDEKATTGPAMSMRYRGNAGKDQQPSPVTTHQDRQQRAPTTVRDWTALPVKETARRIVLGKPYVLECYRRWEQKRRLLLEVVALHDGNAILTVLLFLKRTLRENLFLGMLLEKPAAEHHYVSYLRQLGDLEAVHKFYMMFLRVRQASTLMYTLNCINSLSPGARVKGLEKCIGFFTTHGELSQDVQHLKDELYLLKDVQIPLQRRDDEAEDRKHAVFVQFPRSIAVTSAPLMSTLFYSCLYHFGATERDPFSPERLRKDFKLTERQYLWMAVGARAKARDYNNIEDKLLTVTGWFGRKNQKSAIGFEKVAEILRQYRAPEAEVVKYLGKVDDLDIRLDTARKLDSPSVVIDTLKEKRDRVGLSQYRDRLAPHSSHRREVDQLLVNSTIRWRN